MVAMVPTEGPTTNGRSDLMTGLDVAQAYVQKGGYIYTGWYTRSMEVSMYRRGTLKEATRQPEKKSPLEKANLVVVSGETPLRP